MFTDFLLESFKSNADQDAIIWNSESMSYKSLEELTRKWAAELKKQNVARGKVVALEADFSPTSVALLLALIENCNIIVPFTTSVKTKISEFREIAQVEQIISIDPSDRPFFQETDVDAHHPVYSKLRDAGHPGLVLFSSGSTGKSKAAVHDFVPLLEKFHTSRKAKRMITFLLFDHIGGINTLLYALSNGGCVITLMERSPAAVAKAIQDHGTQILPTSPTFLNLLLMSEVHKKYDFSKLELITYGTEPMPPSTLEAVAKIFPHVALQQTYGLSELGILRSKSKSSTSLWVKVGGEGFETRVVDGLLEIRAKSAMIGYLNAPSPFTEDGWFKTNDLVEVDGEHIRILGRQSEMINVGGEKVYPSEVESVIQVLDGVEEVVVNGESNPIMGQIVVATVKLKTEETLDKFRRRLREFCKDKLPAYKVPQKIVIRDSSLHSTRFKKLRAEL